VVFKWVGGWCGWGVGEWMDSSIIGMYVYIRS
jgi:hypothetical protein